MGSMLDRRKLIAGGVSEMAHSRRMPRSILNLKMLRHSCTAIHAHIRRVVFEIVTRTLLQI